MNVIAITQARMTSSRLPGKILMELGNKSLLEIHLERLSNAQKIDKIILATTNLKSDDVTEEVGKKLGFTVFRGDEHNVLDRFYQALVSVDIIPDYVVRITADCPLIDSKLIDSVIKYTIDNDLDYCSNSLEPQYPDGQDVEVFKFICLEKAWKNATLLSEREHVTPYIRNNSTFNSGDLFKSDNFSEGFNYGHLRMTVDQYADFEVIKELVGILGTDKSWLEYSNCIINNQLSEINKKFTRNEGLLKSLKND
jgi:spore coat polysaccharide biosynthesis protein SpsF